ncbi:hypothetical protein B0H14DRAFT_2601097 [Mycena olivaceomarginata]|nr:hypothetical protein B0H14DRAFT_2601097 [Mycena olivaceomarginata]
MPPPLQGLPPSTPKPKSSSTRVSGRQARPRRFQTSHPHLKTLEKSEGHQGKSRQQHDSEPKKLATKLGRIDANFGVESGSVKVGIDSLRRFGSELMPESTAKMCNNGSITGCHDRANRANKLAACGRYEDQRDLGPCADGRKKMWFRECQAPRRVRSNLHVEETVTSRG